MFILHFSYAPHIMTQYFMFAATILQQQECFDVFSQLASVIDAFFLAFYANIYALLRLEAVAMDLSTASLQSWRFLQYFFSDLAFLPNADIEQPFLFCFFPFLLSFLCLLFCSLISLVIFSIFLRFSFQ